MRRSPLKRKRAKRPMSAAGYALLKTTVAARDGNLCIGIRAGIEHACNLPQDAEHLVEQRDIRQIPEADKALADARLATYCCRNLNGALHTYAWLKLAVDHRRKDLTNIEKDQRARAAIRRCAPIGFEDAVREYGLETPADRKLGVGA